MHALYLLRYPVEHISSSLFASEDAASFLVKIEKALTPPVQGIGEVFLSYSSGEVRPTVVVSYDRLLEVVCEGNPILVF